MASSIVIESPKANESSMTPNYEGDTTLSPLPGQHRMELLADPNDIFLQTSKTSASSFKSEECASTLDVPWEGQEDEVSEEDTVLQEVKRKISQNSVSSLGSSNSAESFNSGLLISEEYRLMNAGLHPRDVYEHGRLMTDILGVVYNGRTRKFVMLDGKGITTWARSKTGVRVERPLEFPAYQYRLLSKLVFARKHNCYFALTRDFQIKVLDCDFRETASVNANLRSVLYMLFSSETDELITAGVGGTKVWHFHKVPTRHYTELRPLANYRLSLRLEIPEVQSTWVRRVEIVSELQHLILCSDRDVYVHHFSGELLYSFLGAHDRTITSAVYSSVAKYLITAGMDAEVRVWSYTGGRIHAFRGHSQAVTTLVLAPTNAQMVISGSLDGCIRLWSLETMEPFYSMTASSSGILYMGLTDDCFLYIGTYRSLSLWTINFFYDFWSLTRDDLRRMWLAGAPGRSTRVLVEGTSGSMRVFGRSSRVNLSTVCPPPNLSPLQTLLGCCYCRINNLVFMLLTPMEVWVYTTRTDPACRIAVWNLEQIQNGWISQKAKRMAAQNFGDKTPLRALMHGLGNDGVSQCLCITLLHAPVIMNTDEGLCCPIQRSFLLLGMEDGRIMFMDPMVKGFKHLDFRVSKDPVVDMVYDESHSCLITQVKVKKMLSFQFWELPRLTLQYEIFCPPDITSYARCGLMFLGGFETGSVHFIPLAKAIDTGLFRSRPMPNRQDLILSHRTKKPEHDSRVTGVDVNTDLRIFLSCSSDGAIKLWQESRHLLAEIQIDAQISCSCFLDKSGNILMGTKNQLYAIHFTHVLPASMISVAAGVELDAVETESYVYEDPAVAYEGIDPNPDPLTLARYLVPFNIEFSKDFLEGRQILDALEESDEEESETSSEYSRAPTDVYLSPRESPTTFSQIDMRLAAGTVLKQDVRAYMRNTLAILDKLHPKEPDQSSGSMDVSEIQPLPLMFEYPRVGRSPGGTPVLSPSIASEESKEEIVKEAPVEERRPSPKALRQESEEESEEEVLPPPPKPSPRPAPPRRPPVTVPKFKDRVSVSAAKIDAKKIIRQEAKKQAVELAKKVVEMPASPPSRRPTIKKQPPAVRKLPKRGSRPSVGVEGLEQPLLGSGRLSVVEIPSVQSQEEPEKSGQGSEEEKASQEQGMQEENAEGSSKTADSHLSDEAASAGDAKATDTDEAASRGTGSGNAEDGEMTAEDIEDEATGEVPAKREDGADEKDDDSTILIQVPELPTIEDVPSTPPAAQAARGRGRVMRPIDVPQAPPKLSAPPKPSGLAAQPTFVPTPPAATHFIHPSPGARKMGEEEWGAPTGADKMSEGSVTSLPTDAMPAPPPPSRASHVPGMTSPGRARVDSEFETEEVIRRPATSYHPSSRKESMLLAERPYTADQDSEARQKSLQLIELGLIFRMPHTPEELEKTYTTALEKYYRGGGETLLSSDGMRFEENWQEREIERHMLLKMRKEIRHHRSKLKKDDLERQYRLTAMESIARKASAEPLFTKMPSYDLPYELEGETVLTFGGVGSGDVSAHPPPAPATSPQASRPSTAPPAHLPSSRRRKDSKSEKEAAERREMSAAKPFRCRLRGVGTEVVQDIRRLDVDIAKFDPRNPHAIRPKSCRSIPSKCNRYVLISKPKPQTQLPVPTMLEEQLLVQRFPKQGLRVLQQFQEAPHRRNKSMYGLGYSPYTQAKNIK